MAPIVEYEHFNVNLTVYLYTIVHIFVDIRIK